LFNEFTISPRISGDLVKDTLLYYELLAQLKDQQQANIKNIEISRNLVIITNTLFQLGHILSDRINTCEIFQSYL
jgi:hypothetical protein